MCRGISPTTRLWINKLQGDLKEIESGTNWTSDCVVFTHDISSMSPFFQIEWIPQLLRRSPNYTPENSAFHNSIHSVTTFTILWGGCCKTNGANQHLGSVYYIRCKCTNLQLFGYCIQIDEMPKAIQITRWDEIQRFVILNAVSWSFRGGLLYPPQLNPQFSQIKQFLTR